MDDILIPISVCVILPISIVWLSMRTSQNETNRKTEVMLKALEMGVPIDPAFFRDTKSAKGVKERLLGRLSAACVTSLLGIAAMTGGMLACNNYSWDLNKSPLPLLVVAGAILTAIGVALFIVFFAGRKMLSREIEAEEKELRQK